MKVRGSVRALLLAVCAVVSFACAAAGPSAEEQRAMQELAAARQASRAGEWKSAASRWNEIRLRADEHAREACTEEARALVELGDGASAQHLAELALKSYPQDAALHAQLARALLAQGYPHAAETAYEHALDAEPGRLDVLRALALLRCDIGRDAEALALLAPHLASGKASAEDFALAGRAQRATKRFAEAFASYERSFALESPAPDRLADAASMVFEPEVLGLDARAASLARAWLAQAVALDPQATAAHLALGKLALTEQRDVEAAGHFRRAVETDPACVPALTALARVQARRGETADSIAMAERALALEKDPERRKELEQLARPESPPAPAPTDPAVTPPRDG